jgi:hypothetical protein
MCRELPRAIAPPSGSFSTGRRPTFQFTLPTGVTSGTLELCQDRACTMVIASMAVTMSGSVRPMEDLPHRTIYWRIRTDAPSPAWEIVPGGRAGEDRPTHFWGDVPDFNGDGYSDVAVGAPLLARPNARFYIFYGTSAGLGTVGRVSVDDPFPASSTALPSQFAWSLAASDFTGDGYTDLAVGTPGHAGNTGRVYVFHGSPEGLNPRVRAVLDGPDGMMSSFGFAIAPVGDVNVDGYNDLAVGAFAAGPGRVRVYYGTGRGLSTSPAVTLDGPTGMSSRFGIALAGVGDIDGDGDGDLIVGSPEYSAGTGRAFLYRGSPTGVSTTPVALVTTMGGRAGFAVSGIGDVNGDGYPDAAMGAPSFNNGSGVLNLFYGSPIVIGPMPSTNINSPPGMESDFGTTIVAAGDTNGDGFDDVLAGAPRVDTFTGRAYLFRGGETGVSPMAVHNLFDISAGARALFGGALGGARDVNNDGFSDIVVTAERAVTFAGQINVLRGSSVGLGSPTVITGPDGSGNRFGISVASRVVRPWCSLHPGG